MSHIRVVTVAMVILVTALLYAASGELSAQAANPALRGVVSSQAEGNMSERLARLDPSTGEIIEYQMPTDFDSKKIAHDPTTDGTTLWMSNTRNARVVRVEPLD